MRAALITGVAGLTLAPREAAFLKEARPAGLILFARNLGEPRAVPRARRRRARGRRLATSFWSSSTRKAGACSACGRRSARKLPPAPPSGAISSATPRRRTAAAFAVARLIAEELEALGINDELRAGPRRARERSARDHRRPRLRHRSCAGDRARPGGCRRLHGRRRGARHQAHPGPRPGHGRQPSRASRRDGERDAELSATDFAPFKALARMPAAMTAHVVFRAIDPQGAGEHVGDRDARVIRGEIGFDGLLMSDDLSA